MSMVIKTTTPFINKKILMEALTRLKVQYSVQGEDLITERKDYYGDQIFEFHNNQYLLQHDSSANDLKRYPNYPWAHNFKQWKTTHAFLQAVEQAYVEVEKQLEETERKRLEEEKRKFMEQRKNKIIEKAKEQGYHVREIQKQNQVQLVLVRHTY